MPAEDENPLTATEVPTTAEKSSEVTTRTSLLFHAEIPTKAPTGEVLAGDKIPATTEDPTGVGDPATKVKGPVTPAGAMVHIHNKSLAGVPPGEVPDAQAKIKTPAGTPAEVEVPTIPAPRFLLRFLKPLPKSRHLLLKSRGLPPPRRSRSRATSCPRADYKLPTSCPPSVHELSLP